MNRSTLLIVVVGVVSFVAAGVLIAVSVLGNSSKAPSATAPLHSVGEISNVFDGIPQHGITLGNPKAKVTVIEFADLQCPYCARFGTDELPSFVAKYVRTGRAKVEFRGLDFVGPGSVRGLETTYAVAQQNKLWQFVELLYANQGSENSGWLSDDLMRRVAMTIGADMDAAIAARSSQAVRSMIDASAKLASTGGVNSTPTLFVDGKHVEPTAAALGQAVAASR